MSDGKIFIIGASHHQSPVELREKLAAITMADLVTFQHRCGGNLKEAILFSTCNRMEIAGVAVDRPRLEEELKEFLAEKTGLPPSELMAHLYLHNGVDAAEHILKVAASLDSQILGEPQILGQMKDSFREAARYRTLGPILSKLMHKSFKAAKRVRTETKLGEGAISVALAAAQMALDFWVNPLSLENTALILGAGPMAAQTAQYLKTRSRATIFIASRTYENAEALAQDIGARPVAWDELPALLSRVDLAVCALRTTEPVFSGPLAAALTGRPAPILLIDIGVPRNVGEDFYQNPQALVKNIDDLSVVIGHNQEARRQELASAVAIIKDETDKFISWLKSLAVAPSIAALSAKAEEAWLNELKRTLKQTSFSPEQQLALDKMGRALVRRLLHDPIDFLKTCGRHGRQEHNLDLARRVLGLDHEQICGQDD